jgi:hypothetical protein
MTGFYLENKNTCTTCGVTGVKTCCSDKKGIRALSCNDGYFLDGSVCVKEDPNCLTRAQTNSFICTKCKDGFYLNERNVCLTGNLKGCKSYTNKDNCGVCNDGFYISAKVDSIQQDRIFKICEDCAANCICDGKETTVKCDRCMSGAYYESASSPRACLPCEVSNSATTTTPLKCTKESSGKCLTGDNSSCPASKYLCSGAAGEV